MRKRSELIRVIVILSILVLGLVGCSGVGTESALPVTTNNIEMESQEPLSEDVTEEVTEEISEEMTEEVIEKITEEVTEEETEEIAEEETEEVTEETAESQEPVQTNTYILNTNTKKFHFVECKSVKKMKESNKLEYTGTRDEVIAQGYSPCGNCHP